MPPKGHKKMKAKGKKLVTSRLMAISLLVDDYIYKNKPISLLEAKKLNEEIISLKPKCKDTRSLQVVEKLKIFMKSIIKEQSIERLQEDSTNIVTERSIDKNPLIVISEDVENNNTNNLTASTNTQLFSNRESQSSEINNIQDIKTQKKSSINVTNPVRSVSNSEIKTVISKDIFYSNNLILTLNDKSEENIKNIYFEVLANPTNEEEQEKQDSVTLTTPNLQKHPEQEKQYLQENLKSIKITPEIKTKQKQTKANKKTNKNKTTVKTNIKTKAKQYINKDLEKKSTNKSSQSKKKPKEQKQINMSWVENIKNVREVSTDEHTDLQIEDNFWSNLDLPGIWNANDFD